MATTSMGRSFSRAAITFLIVGLALLLAAGLAAPSTPAAADQGADGRLIAPHREGKPPPPGPGGNAGSAKAETAPGPPGTPPGTPPAKKPPDAGNPGPPAPAANEPGGKQPGGDTPGGGNPGGAGPGNGGGGVPGCTVGNLDPASGQCNPGGNNGGKPGGGNDCSAVEQGPQSAPCGRGTPGGTPLNNEGNVPGCLSDDHAR